MLAVRRWESGCCGLLCCGLRVIALRLSLRLEAVAEATSDLRRREGLRRGMDGVLDLERLLGRVALDSAGPREVLALAATLGCLPGLLDALKEFGAQRWASCWRMALMRWRICTR